ncbi:QRFPR-like protein [Mya arenaria]|uniref:QRFPR-like protein n=1 Tax=Mya arenaria TaxID=6604 RepID=A0ABY7E7D2_MYAAR|nr:QRFPR-like protein [Mya arenaria]
MTAGNISVNAEIGNESTETPEFPRYLVVTSTVFYVFIFLFGILGNLLVIVVVCLNRNMKTSVNIFLINLCIADLLVLMVCMPTALTDLYARDIWYFGKAMCQAVPFLENTVAHASILTLIAISIERYRPLRGIGDNVTRTAKVLPFLWTICATCNIPWLYIAKYKDSFHLDGTAIKVCRIPMILQWQKTFATLQFVFFFVLPFLTLLILYCNICYILNYSRDVDLNNSKHCRHRRQLRMQVINIIVCLVLLFFIFHLPYRLVSMWLTYAQIKDIYGLGIERYYGMLFSVRILFYLNHAVNPIIYNFVSTKFRNGFRQILTSRSHRGSLVSSNRRGNYNTPFTRPKQTILMLEDRDVDKKGLVQVKASSSSSSRQKMNEFYPMYTNMIVKHNSSKHNTSVELKGPD